MTKKFLLAMIGLYALLSPFYVFASGLPQPADFLIPIILCVALLLILKTGHIRIAQTFRIPVAAVVSFLLVALFVNGVWAIVLGDPIVLLPVLFYTFNVSVFLLLVWLFSAGGTDILPVVVKAFAWSSVLQVILLPLSFDGNFFRQMLFFNNPNQLGYYGLICLTFCFIGRDYLKMPSRVPLLGGFASLLLISLSLSSAAILGAVLLLILATSRRTLTISIPVLIVFSVLLTSYDEFLLERLSHRVTTIGLSADDSLEGRGYDRLWNHPEHLLLGAGEGVWDRFEGFLSGEIHSSWATVAFAYGLLGVLAWSVLFFWIWKEGGTRVFLYLAPVIFYGLTHQGLRFTPFWFLLGVVCCVALYRGRVGHTADELTISRKATPGFVRSPAAMPESLQYRQQDQES